MQCDPHVESAKEAFQAYPIKVIDYFKKSQEEIAEIVDVFRPTYIIILGAVTDHIKVESLALFQRYYNVKIIYLVPEASHPDWKAQLDKLKSFVNLIVNLDGDYAWDPERKNYTTLAIYGQKAYDIQKHNNWNDRPINVGFCGGMGSLQSSRKRLIDYLKSLEILTTFPFIETCDTYNQYVDFMMSCKIVVNAAGSSDDKSKHVKGRLVEAGLAGCCLIEEEGSPISLWFEQGSYFTFTTPEHCAQVIEYLLKNPEIAANAANKLYKQVREKYSPRKVWDEIITRC
jgi:hypothetical protein